MTTPEERRERSLRASRTLGPEGHRARGLKSARALTPEERSERSRRGAESLTPEERSERSRRAAATRKLHYSAEERSKEMSRISMARRPPWMLAMLEVLADGEWHDITKVVRAGTPKVPPSKALAAYRTNVVKKRAHPDQQLNIKATDTTQQIRDGRWSLCRKIVTSWNTRGVVEYSEDGTQMRATDRLLHGEIG